jgi:hypothetical protein
MSVVLYEKPPARSMRFIFAAHSGAASIGFDLGKTAQRVDNFAS